MRGGFFVTRAWAYARSWVNRSLLLLLGAATNSCALVGNLTQLDDAWYRVVPTGRRDSVARALGGQRVYVQQHADTLLLTVNTPAGAPVTSRYQLSSRRRLQLLRRRFDLDVFTIPFKLRPPQGGLPVQLNTNFNAAVYLGRRLDFYTVRTRRDTPFGATPHIHATGLGYGGFIGVGSTAITGDVTGQQAAAEYEGMVLHTGLAAIYDARAFNVGLAIGADQLLGPDRRSWLYQRKPWFGVLFGLDLN